MFLREAVRADLPQLLALLRDEDHLVDPETVSVTRRHEDAFAAIVGDPRNEIVVLDDGDGTVLGFLQITYIPGLSRDGEERALLEGVRVRPDRRGAGLGGRLVRHAVDRARDRGCGLVQLTSNKVRHDAHRFYLGHGFAQSHEGFKLRL